MPDPLVDYDSVYEALGKRAVDRHEVYRDYVFQTIPVDELQLIRKSIQRNQVTGENRCREQLEKKYSIRLSNRGPGRPKKNKK